MKIRVIGAGWYGLSLAWGLTLAGHDVFVFEAADKIFAGASGNCPARLHLGAPHYPRSRATQIACAAHRDEFMARYGFLTRNIPINIYAVAARDSLLDFGAYTAALRGAGTEFVTVYDPAEFGLENIDGAVLTPERHILTGDAIKFFTELLGSSIALGSRVTDLGGSEWDLTLDCSFAANDAENVDRYEPCLMVLMKGPVDRAVTVVDGQFGSLYLWDEAQKLSSLTSARYTPFSKTCRSYGEARNLLDRLNRWEIKAQADAMIEQMAHFWPASRDLYEVADYRLSIRAMPRSGADSRLVDVRRVGDRAIQVRAGKIDAVIEAERIVKEMLR